MYADVCRSADATGSHSFENYRSVQSRQAASTKCVFAINRTKSYSSRFSHCFFGKNFLKSLKFARDELKKILQNPGENGSSSLVTFSRRSLPPPRLRISFKVFYIFLLEISKYKNNFKKYFLKILFRPILAYLATFLP